MLLYIHFLEFFVPAKQEPAQSRSKSDCQSNSNPAAVLAARKRQSAQAVTKQLHELKSNYSLERRLFW